MPRNVAVLDACVLYPSHLRNLLVQLATTDLCRARWTEQIHDEWIRNLLKNRPDITLQQLQNTKNAMNRAVLDCLVTDFESCIPTLSLPDPDDRHVLAAGIVAKADVIVTINLKDFPDSVLAGYGITAQHPDDFIADLIDFDSLCVLEAVRAILRRLKKPPVDFEDYLEILRQQGLPISVSMLREIKNEV